MKRKYESDNPKSEGRRSRTLKWSVSVTASPQCRQWTHRFLSSVSQWVLQHNELKEFYHNMTNVINQYILGRDSRAMIVNIKTQKNCFAAFWNIFKVQQVPEKVDKNLWIRDVAIKVESLRLFSWNDLFLERRRLWWKKKIREEEGKSFKLKRCIFVPVVNRWLKSHDVEFLKCRIGLYFDDVLWADVWPC